MNSPAGFRTRRDFGDHYEAHSTPRFRSQALELNAKICLPGNLSTHKPGYRWTVAEAEIR